MKFSTKHPRARGLAWAGLASPLDLRAKVPNVARLGVLGFEKAKRKAEQKAFRIAKQQAAAA